MLVVKGFNQGGHDRGWFIGHGFKDGRVLEGLVDRLIINTWAKYPKRGSMFVLAVENGAIKGFLQSSNRLLCDVVGDL